MLAKLSNMSRLKHKPSKKPICLTVLPPDEDAKNAFIPSSSSNSLYYDDKEVREYFRNNPRKAKTKVKIVSPSSDDAAQHPQSLANQSSSSVHSTSSSTLSGTSRSNCDRETSTTGILTNTTERYPIHQILHFQPSKATVQLIHKQYPVALSLAVDPVTGWTPLHAAIQYGASSDVIEYLMEQNPSSANVQAYGDHGWLPLHMACQRGSEPAIVRVILECMDNEASGFLTARLEGYTPLHQAILCHRYNMVDQTFQQHVLQLLIHADPACLLVPFPECDDMLPYKMASVSPTCADFSRKLLRRATKIALQADEKFETRHELEAKIENLTSRIGNAITHTTMALTATSRSNSSSTLNNTMNQSTEIMDSLALTKSIVSMMVVERLQKRMEQMDSIEQLRARIREYERLRDMANALCEIGTADQHHKVVLNLTLKLEREEAAISGSAGVSSLEESRQLVRQGLESSETWKAKALSLSFLLKCTKQFSEAKQNILGEGGFGRVYLGLDPAGQTKFAVKRIFQDKLRGDIGNYIIQSLWFEVKSLSELDHPNIVRLLGYHLSERPQEPQCLVYELAGGGSLSSLLKKEGGRKILNWNLRIKTMASVASALGYLHSRRPAIYHRDIKPGNITYSEDFEKVILIDFGIAIEVDADVTRTSVTVADAAGTANYMSPEYKATYRYGPKCDVYSLGVVMAVLLTCEKPGSDIAKLLAMPFDPLAGDLDNSIYLELAQLVRRCCSADPLDRPTAAQLHIALFDLQSRCQRPLSEDEKTKITVELSKSRIYFGSKGEKISKVDSCNCGLENVRGLSCRNGDHFSCKSCFHEHLVDSIGESDVFCRVPECKSEPFTLDQLKDHSDEILLAKHLEIKQQHSLSQDQANVNAINLDTLRKVIREEASDAIQNAARRFGAEVRKVVDEAFTPHTNRIMRSLEIIAKDEVKCPKLCFITLPKGNRGSRGVASMMRSLKTLSHTSALLYFVCAYDKTPITVPLELQKSKRWLQIVAPAIKVSIIVASIALQFNTAFPIQLHVPDLGVNDYLRDMDALMDNLVSTTDAELIEAYVKDQMQGPDNGNYRRSSSFTTDSEATLLTRAAYREIQKVADEQQDSWQYCMALAQCKSTGEWGWVKKENEEKWINAVE